VCSINKTFVEATRDFAKGDPEMMARKSGAAYNAQLKQFTLRYLGNTYLVSFPDGAISSETTGHLLAIEEKALILLYLCQASGEILAQQWLSFSELPSGIMHDVSFKADALRPLADLFGKQPEKLLQVAQSLGGSKLEIGDQGVSITVFPRIVVGLILWLGDEDFPDTANMVLDAVAPKYMTTAELFTLGLVVSKRIIEAARALL
jgi:hypothetical protein